ncbi:MAG TPA: hypothetical protein VFR90_00400 [Methylibium sp.]|uniref:hypothetical protein n=1 Tax=Methylibium sp. TaxID=2067992 RepID=UPI002DBA0BE6|nr:hypothetical protein [Methylibium sp.]HEU4457564.1 hypothetical protein [Methylibium sp.]
MHFLRCGCHAVNLSPSRHPAFIAIACLSLLAAWSTPEADVAPGQSTLALVEALPPTLRTPPKLEADCLTHAAAQRALCVYAATRSGSIDAPPAPHMAADSAGALGAARSAKSATRSTHSSVLTTSLLDETHRLERSLLPR